MKHHTQLYQDHLANLTPEIKSFLNKTRAELKGTKRRKFMARVVSLMGKGGQRKALKELGWNRDTIRKGMKEDLAI